MVFRVVLWYSTSIQVPALFTSDAPLSKGETTGWWRKVPTPIVCPLHYLYTTKQLIFPLTEGLKVERGNSIPYIENCI